MVSIKHFSFSFIVLDTCDLVAGTTTMNSSDSYARAPAYSDDRYLRWEYMFKTYLGGKGADLALIELAPDVAEFNLTTKEGRDNHREEMKRFSSRAGMAFAALNEALSAHPHLIDWIKGLTDAAPQMPFPTLMAAFKAKYISRNNANRIHHLNTAFIQMKINPGEPAADFYIRVRTAGADLAAVGGHVNDSILCMILQNGVAGTGYADLNNVSYNISAHPKPFAEWQHDMECWDDNTFGKEWAKYKGAYPTII